MDDLEKLRHSLHQVRSDWRPQTGVRYSPDADTFCVLLEACCVLLDEMAERQAEDSRKKTTRTFGKQ